MQFIINEGSHSFDELKKATALPEAKLWSAIGWPTSENKIEIRNTKTQLAFSPGMNCDF